MSDHYQEQERHYRGSDDGFRLRVSPTVLLVYLAVLASLLGVGWYAGTRATEERREALVYEPSDLGQTTDSFDRDVAPTALGSDTAAEPIPWAVLGSGFEATELGVARVAATPQGENSMALTDPGVSDLTLLATVDSAPQGAAVVFRFQDVFNHWSLVSAPDFGSWNLVLTVDGVETYSESIGLSSNQPGTSLAIGMAGPNIRVFVDGQPMFALVDPTFQQATSVGLMGVNGSDAGFDEFTYVENDLALVPAAPAVDEGE